MKLVNNYDQINYVLISVIFAILLLIFVVVYLFNRFRSSKLIIGKQAEVLCKFLEEDVIRTEKITSLTTELINDVQFSQTQMVLFTLLLKSELGIVVNTKKSPDATKKVDPSKLEKTLIEKVKFNQSQIEKLAFILKTKLDIDMDENSDGGINIG